MLAEVVEGHSIGERVVGGLPIGAQALDGWAIAIIDFEANRPVLLKEVSEDELGDFCEERVDLARRSVAIAGNDRVAGDDVRTLEVTFGPDGSRSRTFRQSVGEMVPADMEDFPFAIRTAQEYCKEVARVAESFSAPWQSWVVKSRIPDGDGGEVK